MTTTPNLSSLNAAVAGAVTDIHRTFAPDYWVVEPDGGGGARVRFGPVSLTDTYVQEDTWVGAHIPAQTPYADIYPIFVRGDLARTDGTALVAPVTSGHSFMGQQAVQVSRRTNGMTESGQTATQKLQKVLAWLRSQ